jgi:catechol 2,3-dioxygenase-like lactoylglutathione lyase family enzyme
VIKKVSHVTLLVRDQDEALEFYTGKLGFKTRYDMTMPEGFRWLTVAPPGQPDFEVILMKADSAESENGVGRQAPGSLLFIVATDDCRADYAALKAKGVEFLGEPTERPWGLEAMFRDLYGNLLDLLEPNK